MSILEIERLVSGYNGDEVLHGVTLTIAESEIVTLLGPNGSGKSTVLKAISGLLKTWQGRIIFKGKDIQNRDPALNVREGLCLALQGGRVFDELTVRENLDMGAYLLKGHEVAQRIAGILELFSALKPRVRQKARTLSGGEKQMLALGRALVLNPTLLLLDEPSLGLSPRLSKALLAKVKEINEKTGCAILIVEQNVREALSISNRAYLMRLGKIVLEKSSSELLRDDKIKNVFFS